MPGSQLKEKILHMFRSGTQNKDRYKKDINKVKLPTSKQYLYPTYKYLK